MQSRKSVMAANAVAKLGTTRTVCLYRRSPCYRDESRLWGPPRLSVHDPRTKL